MTKGKFKIILIKPAHYDADGYVIQWWRSTMPSNSLASIYALLAEAPRSACLDRTSISRSMPATSATPSST